MICDKRMKYIMSDEGMDYYIYTPSLFRQYFNNIEEWTPHRKLLTHKLHMLLFFLRGGYHILYMIEGEKIVSYLVFTKCGRTVIKGSTRKDLFTVFITTHPDYRKKGFASKLAYVLLNKIGIEYDTAYKTILDSNVGSIKVAQGNGYEKLYPVTKHGIFKTIIPMNNGSMYLYERTH